MRRAGRERALVPCRGAMASRAALLLACLAPLASPGCAPADPAARLRSSPPRNLLLVTIDTLRADRLGWYGYAAARTPALDALAAEGVRFEEAVTPAPLTLPAHASLLSGRLPAAHGVHANGRNRLPAGIPTLAEALAGSLPRRGAIVASVVLDRLFGLERGFGDYDDRMPPPAPERPLAARERRASEVAALAETWLGRSRDPFFLWVHLFDPHAPYEAPAEWARGAAHPYDAEESAARFAALLKEDPGNPFARRHQARSLLALGREAEGEREYRRLLEEAPGDAEALHTLGTRALRAGRLDEAERLLRSAAQAAPWDPRIRNTLAYLAARAGDTTAARQMLEEILAEHPLLAEAVLNLAALERRAGRAAVAERVLRDFLRRAPSETAARRALAGLLREQGRASEARALEEEETP